jgi:hypothetical protein
MVSGWRVLSTYLFVLVLHTETKERKGEGKGEEGIWLCAKQIYPCNACFFSASLIRLGTRCVAPFV